MNYQKNNKNKIVLLIVLQYNAFMKKTTQQFIEQAKSIHGSKYDYTETEYNGTVKDVEIYCNECKSYFSIRAANHLAQKQGCKKCNNKKRIVESTRTSETFIKKAKEVHGDIYDYSLVDYKTNKQKVQIICKKHGAFEQTPNHHMRGRGCKQCGVEAQIEKCKNKASSWSHHGWEKNGKESIVFKGFSVYIIECWSENEVFIKIGKTFSGVQARFTNVNMPYQWKLLKEYIGSAEYISKLEHSLHAKFKEYQYKPEIKFAGATECFSIDIKKGCIKSEE